MKYTVFNLPCIYPTVLLGKYSISNGVKPNDIFVRHPIEWLVVEKDLQNRRALLVTRHTIDWEGFADCPIIGSGYDTSWDESYLKAWLNDDFYNDCFSSEEKERIIPISDKTKESTDKVFLLSVDEIMKYFGEGTSAIAFAPIVDRVTTSGIKDELLEISYSPTIWWTRTLGKTKDVVMCVDSQGTFCEMDSNCDEVGVRPAVWVSF